MKIAEAFPNIPTIMFGVFHALLKAAKRGRPLKIVFRDHALPRPVHVLAHGTVQPGDAAVVTEAGYPTALQMALTATVAAAASTFFFMKPLTLSATAGSEAI